MNYDDFIRIRDEGIIPDDIHVLLQAILLDAAGDWDSAHRIARDEFTKEGYWVHAYLHRKEGDLSNALYWYGNAGRKIPETNLEEEWESIAKTLLEIYQ
jgi:hypothetical protein